MASVWIKINTFKDGRRSYSIYYKDPPTSKTKYYKTLRKRGLADRASNDLRTYIDTGKWLEIEDGKKKVQPKTLKQCSDITLADFRSKVRKGNKSPETLKFHEDQHRSVLRELGNPLVIELTRAKIEKYLDGEEKEDLPEKDSGPKKFSPRTANARLLALKMMTKAALKENVISKDPTIGIGYYREEPRDRSLTPQELNALLLGCKGTRNPARMKAAILLAAEHGASLQEVMDLCWSHIDFDRHGFGTIEFARRKNRVERIQYLMPRTRSSLVEWKEHQDWIRKRKRIEPTSDLVFGRLDGRAVDRLDTAWATVLAAARIEDLHFHDLRAVYCTNLALTGASTKIIQNLIGHKDPRSTDRYLRFERLFQLSEWQARLASMYEFPEVFDQVMCESRKKKVLQISGKVLAEAQKNGVADLATPRYNEENLVGANGFEPSTP